MMKQVLLAIKYNGEWIFQNDQLQFHSIEYDSLFDAYDNFAAARYLYQLTTKTEIITVDEYSNIINTAPFLNLLKVVSNADVVESTIARKIFYLEYDVPGHRTNKIPQTHESHEIISKCGNQQYTKNFALLITETEHRDSWPIVYQALYYGLYREAGEKWTSYDALENEFPEDLDILDGVVITGSSSASYDDTQAWITLFYKNIQKLEEKQVRTLGICFGHQILAHCLGGQAAYAEYPEISIGRTYLNSSILMDGQIIKDLGVYVFHGDEVKKLPPHMEVCMSSAYCPIFGFQNQHMLCVQFHPEFNPVMLSYCIKVDMVMKNKDYYMERCFKTFLQGQDNSHVIWQLMLRFLKQGKLIEYQL